MQLPSYCFLQLRHPNTWWAGHAFKPQSCKPCCTGWSPPQWSHTTEASRLAHDGQVQHTCKGCTLGAWKCTKLTWKPPSSELAWPHCDQPSPETKPDKLLICPTQSLVLGRGQNVQHACLKWGALSGGRLSSPRHGALQFTWLRAHQEWPGGKTPKAGCWPLLLPSPSSNQSWFRLPQSENTSHAVCWV